MRFSGHNLSRLKWNMSEKNTKLIYSTGRTISRKAGPAGDIPVPSPNPALQKVTVRLDRKQRGGKSVTVIEGLQLPVKEREAMLRRLKAGLGTGGTVKDSTLEIQGDHCDAIITALNDLGYRPKRSGS